MNLLGLLRLLDSNRNWGVLPDFEVTGVSCDSRRIKDGFVFVALKGADHDGHDFIDKALKSGARAVLVERLDNDLRFTCDVPVIAVDNTHKALGVLSAGFYGNPSQSLKVVGITGTNGKTTITYLIEALLQEAGVINGVIGTINYRFKDKVISSVNTTPGPDSLQMLLKEILDHGSEYAVMEVSSHALEQERVSGVKYHSAIFTNLTQDHLDYHHDMESYFAAKAKLFSTLDRGAFAVVNADDEYGKRLFRSCPAKTITYGIKYNVDFLAKDILFDAGHTEFVLRSMRQEIPFKVKLIGRHNVYNLLAVVAWGVNAGFDLQLIKRALERFNFVPGRLEPVENKRGINVFVDYAHTEDALYNVITTLRELTKKRLAVVFGCGGNRDKSKRPNMGRVVSQLADHVIITADNPRNEDPLAIIEDIKRGMVKNNYRVILDRREAIRESLAWAIPGDIVLVAGKGHEDYQIFSNGKIHFNDSEVVRECLT